MNIAEKNKLEELIRTSKLFSLNKQTEYVAYKREAMKMVEYLYRYLLAVNENKYIEFGYEIMLTAKRCISNFKSELGDFLNYFNAAWAKEYRRAYGKRQAEEFRCGIHITDEEKLLVRRFLRLIESRHYDVAERNIENLVSNGLGLPIEKTRYLIQLVNDTTVISDMVQDEDGELDSIFDFLNVENEFSDFTEAKRILKAIDDVYQSIQDRQKPLIARVATSKISDSLLDGDELFKFVQELSFFDKDIYLKYKNGCSVKAKEIASFCGVSEQSASRSWKNFTLKILEKLKGER